MQLQCRVRGRQWNLHAGMKISQLDDFASDGELEMEDELPDEGMIKVNDPMVNMMVDLGDDGEWLPWREQMKKDARITGKIISYQSQEIEDTHWSPGKRKSHSHGPDIAAKSAQTQQYP